MFLKKILLISLITFFFCSSYSLASSNGADLSRKEILKRLKPRLKKGQEKYLLSKEAYYHLSFPSKEDRDFTERRNLERWLSNEIMIFSKKRNSPFTQLALISKECGIRKSAEVMKGLKFRAMKFFEGEVAALFNADIRLGDGPFDKLALDDTLKRRINLRQRISGVKRIRLGMHFYKCDGRSGVGYRLDFFFRKQSSR